MQYIPLKHNGIFVGIYEENIMKIHSKGWIMLIAGFTFFMVACNNDDYTKGPTEQPENQPGNTDTTVNGLAKKGDSTSKDSLPTAAAANKDGKDSASKKRKIQH